MPLCLFHAANWRWLKLTAHQDTQSQNFRNLFAISAPQPRWYHGWKTRIRIDANQTFHYFPFTGTITDFDFRSVKNSSYCWAQAASDPLSWPLFFILLVTFNVSTQLYFSIGIWLLSFHGHLCFEWRTVTGQYGRWNFSPALSFAVTAAQDWNT